MKKISLKVLVLIVLLNVFAYQAAISFASVEESLESYTVTGDFNTEGLQFGYAVSISGDTMIVGQPDANTVYVFNRESGGWKKEQVLLSEKKNIDFGVAVDISDNYIVVAAPEAEVDGDKAAGKVFVYEKIDGKWKAVSELNASDYGILERFGGRVKIDGDRIVVTSSAKHNGNRAAGKVYIYKRENGKWIEESILTEGDGVADNLFGFQISISGSYAVIATHETQEVYVYKYDGLKWSHLQTLEGESSDEFGKSISIFDETIVIGEPEANVKTEDGSKTKRRAGKVHVYELKNSKFEHVKTLTAKELNNWLEFGDCVDISGDYIAVGAPEAKVNGVSDAGMINIFIKKNGEWVYLKTITAEVIEASAYFGETIALTEDYVVVGNSIASVNDLRGVGAVYTTDLKPYEAKPFRYNSLNITKPAFQRIKESIELSADVSEGLNVQYQYWMKGPDSEWALIQDYSNSSTYTYTPEKMGNYSFGVRVIDDLSASYQEKTIEYVVKPGADLNFLLSVTNINSSAYLKREQMLAILAELHHVREEAESFSIPANFSDVSDDDWFAPYVRYGYYQGWTAGIGDGTFGVGGSVDAKMFSTLILKSMNHNVPDYSKSVEQLRATGVQAIFEDESKVTFQEAMTVIDNALGMVPLSGSLTLQGLEALPQSGLTVDEEVVLAATVESGNNVEYQFWAKEPGCGWSVIQAYSNEATCSYVCNKSGIYQFGVWVIDNNHTNHKVEIIDYTVVGQAVEPVKLNALNTNKTGNTSEKDVAVTLSGDVSGGSNVQYQYWVMQPGGAWKIAQRYSSTGTFTYTPKIPGTYKFGIWVIDDNNKNHQIDIIDYTVTESEVIPVKLNKLNTDQVGNTSNRNIAVTLNPDVTGGSNAQYQFWVKKPGCGWEVVQSYSSLDSYTYVPSSAGNYQFGIWVIDDNNKNQQIDIIDFTVTESSQTPVKLNKLSTNKSGNTSALNTPITLSADITGGTNVQYQFWVKRPGLGWEVVKTYSSVESYAYTPSSAGNYQFGIWVIDDNNKNQQIEIIDYTVTSEAVQSVTLNSLDTNTGNTSEEDVAVTLNADVTGGSNVQYQFWVKRPGRGWEIAQSYSSTDHYTYTPRSAGAYEFGLWVIDDNNKVQQIEIISHTVEVKATSPVKLNGLATNNVSNSSDVELPIKLMADISGGSNVQYQFWVKEPGRGWKITQSYSSTDSYTYTPSLAGVYEFGIWVIDDNNGKEQVEIINYTVTDQSGDELQEVRMSADELVVEEPMAEETPAVEETHEEVIVKEPAVEEPPVEEEIQEEVIIEGSVVEETPATEETQEETIEEESVEGERPAAEESQEEVKVEAPVEEEASVTEEPQEEVKEEASVEKEAPVTEEPQEEVIEEQPIQEEVQETIE